MASWGSWKLAQRGNPESMDDVQASHHRVREPLKLPPIVDTSKRLWRTARQAKSICAVACEEKKKLDASETCSRSSH